MNDFDKISWEEIIRNAIDILIVTYIVYHLIVIVRGTRALHLLRGTFVLVVIWTLSVYLKLNTLNWLMHQVVTFGVIGIVIIFQPELRRGLEQLGRGKLFSRTGTSSEDLGTLVEEIMKCTRYLRRRNIGALIVLERETGLNEYIQSGIAMQSLVSSELLINTFMPNTPLHDGAVIIQDKLIAAAGCYLPLSENPFISKELGTRHRAAIGLSEVTDAICLIISEETGQISMSIGGQILRDIDEEAVLTKLYDALEAVLIGKDKWNWFWRREGERRNE